MSALQAAEKIAVLLLLQLPELLLRTVLSVSFSSHIQIFSYSITPRFSGKPYRTLRTGDSKANNIYCNAKKYCKYRQENYVKHREAHHINKFRIGEKVTHTYHRKRREL